MRHVSAGSHLKIPRHIIDVMAPRLFSGLVMLLLLIWIFGAFSSRIYIMEFSSKGIAGA